MVETAMKLSAKKNAVVWRWNLDLRAWPNPPAGNQRCRKEWSENVGDEPASDSRAPMKRTAPTGASSPQRLTPLAEMNVPDVHLRDKRHGIGRVGRLDQTEIVEIPGLQVDGQVAAEQQLIDKGNGR